jgi:4-amino-4-deoxy-L-arabinose transferase-like glycosyltransferase
VEIAKRTVGRGAALWAGWAWAVVPVFFQWPTTWVWDMAISALLLALAFMFALRLGESPRPASSAWASVGAFWGIALLTNPGLLTFLPFSLAWPFLQLKAQPLRSRVRLVATALLALAVVVAPWMVRNSLLYHRLTFIRGNFGFELHMGNFHYSNGMGWGGYHPSVNPRELEKYKTLGEAAYIRENQSVAMKFTRENPAEFLQLTIKRFVDFWDGTAIDYNPLDPHWFIHRFAQPWPRYIHCGLSLLAFWGLLLAVGSRIKAAWLFASLILYPTAYYLTYTAPRYRHAIEPEMLILSVYLVYEVARAVSKRFPGRAKALPLAA